MSSNKVYTDWGHIHPSTSTQTIKSIYRINCESKYRNEKFVNISCWYGCQHLRFFIAWFFQRESLTSNIRFLERFLSSYYSDRHYTKERSGPKI